MATTTISSAPRRHAGSAVLAAIGTGFVAVARFFCVLSKAHRCAQELERLTALSDADLARRGLKRDEIVSYVFRNHMFE